MPKLSVPLLLAFQDELEKIGAIHPAVGAGALLGAAGGIGTGYLGYSKAKAEGASTGEALGRAAKSGLIGAAGGAAAGAGLAHVAPGVGKELSNFGQRQVHGVTGWTPKEGLHSIDHGAGPALARRAEAHAAHVLNPNDPKAMKALENATKGSDAAVKAEGMGITSLPGTAKSLKNNGIIPTFRAAANEQIHGSSTFNKAVMLGMSAVSLASAVAAKEDESAPSDGNRPMGRGERIGQTVGGVTGSLVGGPLPFVGGEALSQVAGGAGKLIGRGVDKLRGVRPGQPKNGASSTDLTNGQATGGHEVEMSPRYSGTAAEGGSFA